jgi:hypothetical protein
MDGASGGEGAEPDVACSSVPADTGTIARQVYPGPTFGVKVWAE